ncbi:MAG: hypothetical protein ACREV7_21700 [Steroidobacteraceae bacterium]
MPVLPDGLWGDHWEAPDALWPANGQNQEGARELREAVAQSTVYSSGFRMGAGRARRERRWEE